MLNGATLFFSLPPVEVGGAAGDLKKETLLSFFKLPTYHPPTQA